MRGYALVNETGVSAFTPDLMREAARVLAVQRVELADWWERRPLPVSVADSIASVPIDPGIVIVHTLMTLDDPEALAYHTKDQHGRKIIRVGWGIIKANGGTLTGPNSWLTAASHELCETDVDPDCGDMIDLPDGSAEIPKEVCDPVQGDSYESEPGSGLYLSNFVGPRWFNDGSDGPYDQMGMCTRTFELRPGGYLSKRVGGPGGAWNDVFGAHPAAGGMPQWQRDAKLRAGTRHQLRQA